MRLVFTCILLIVGVALAAFAVIARRSHRPGSSYVALLDAAFLPPVIGNMIIIAAGDKLISDLGSYLYYIGMDLVMIALLEFSFNYCRLTWKSDILKRIVYALLILDAVQILLNPITGFTFTTEGMVVDGYMYYQLIPLAGQKIHRIIDYGVFFGVLVMFIYKVIRSPRIYLERYLVILLTMIFTGMWETFYIISGTPIDTSMIGFGVFGLLVFYFAIYYRPMRLLDSMLGGIASEMPEALFFFDAIGRCIWANRPGQELTGVEEGEFELAEGRLEEIFGNYGQDRQEWSLQHVSETEEGKQYYLLEKHTILSADRPAGSFLSIRDNTEEQLTLQREQRIARHDALTGVYTKEYLFTKTQEMLQENPDKSFVVILSNVNDFKLVNDIFGVDFGDYVLRSIADSIRRHVHSRTIYGRIGGDTFGACLPAEDFDPERVSRLVSNYVVTDGNVSHEVLVHVGVYEVSKDDNTMDVSLMYDRARIALSTIKNNYQVHVAYYDEDMRRQVLWNQHISSQLADALRERQIRPYLQPMVNTSGRVIGAEALVRWIHPEDGFLAPVRFIPLFERNGMIAEVDKYMWRCACEILSRWKDEGRDMFISINISPKDFYFMDVAEEIRSVVREFGVDPGKLRIELTETVMMTDIENRVAILNDLKKEGFIVEMDDFGSGYSSLNLLKDMPVDLIKIDMTFLNESKDNEKAETILHNIISMSDELGISTLTEGVETESQYRMLASMGCKLFQGYYFSRPMPVDEFEVFCNEQNA